MKNWNYKVTPNEDYLDPEETLSDQLSSARVEHPVSDTAFNMVLAVFGAVLAVYGLYLFNLEALRGKDFKALAKENSSLGYIIPASRGIIYDRQGKKLAYNVPEFSILVVSKYFPKEQVEIDKNIEFISMALGVSFDALKSQYEADKNQSLFALGKNITKDQAINIDQANLPGVSVISSPKRIYPYGEYAAHVTGYTSKVSPQDLQDDSYYSIQDRKGRSGVEEYYEAEVRGQHGWIQFAQGLDAYVDYGQPGNDVVLNIDAEAQKRLSMALTAVLNSAGLKRGAAVLQNPNSGAIIALVSNPGFDSNIFQEQLSQTDADYLFNNKLYPLFNRAVGGLYSPGSTIKPLYALAGLNEEVIRPSTTITDTKGYITLPSQFDPTQFFTFRDWKIQGTVDLRGAIAQSSDIYFYSVGGGYGSIKGLGITRIVSYLKSFMADEKLGVDIPGESQGFVPTPDWKRAVKKEAWYTGDTYNVSIGQGDLIASPLWLNTYISAVANGGVLFQPSLLDKIVDAEGRAIKTFSPVKLKQVDIPKEDFNVVRSGMREAVESGTAQLLKDLPQPVAAKTGTAEVVKGQSSNSLISVYGPYQDPEFTLSIIIEGVSLQQQGLALRAARDFLDWHLSPEK